MAKQEAETIQMTKDEIERMIHPPLNLSQYIEPVLMGLMVVLFMWWLIGRAYDLPFLPWKIKEHRRKKREDIARRRERANRPSEFVERKSQTDTVFDLPKVVKVTARTDIATGQVSIEWEFRGAPPQRQIEFFYTDNADALDQMDALRKAMAVPEDAGIGGFLAAMATGMEKAQKAETAMAKGGQHSAARHLPQMFHPLSTGINGHVEQVLPEGLWYIKVRVKTDTVDDGFVYIANLAKTVRAAARTAQPKAPERSPEEIISEEIKRAVSSVKSVEQVVRTFAEIRVKIEADSTLSASQQRDLIREVQMEQEQLIRKLRASGR